MRILLRKALLPCLVAALAVACGGSPSDSSPDSSPPPGSGSPPGGPRLAWDQFAPGADELGRYSYVLYVDGKVLPLPGAACGALAAATLTAACTAPLPALSPGQHTLEMATRVTENGVVLESAKSESITYNAGGTATGSVTQGAQAEGSEGEGRREAAGELPYAVEAAVTGLDGPIGLARLPDGRLLIAERGGAIRIAERGGALLSQPAALLPDADPAVDAVASLAPAPDFEVRRSLYVGYAAIDAQGARTGRVVRFREAGGVLGEAAVILDGLPAALAAPSVAIGPDGFLYVATSSAGSGEAADLGSHAGKILRFDLDGASAADNPWPASPVYGFGYRELRGIGWEGHTGILWALETDKQGAALLRAAAGGPGAPVAALGQVGPARMAFLPARATGAPAVWRGSLFVAAPAQQCLLRVSGLSASPAVPAVERLFQGAFGRIGLVLAADDGLYFATSNGAAGSNARAGDVVYRVREHAGSLARRLDSP
jgi:glucose/arabinose dehydrogenase